MSDHWSFYLKQVEAKPASILLDLGIAQSVPLAGYTHLGEIRLEMLSPRPDGLSSNEEFQALADLEDAVMPMILSATSAIHVGRMTTGGNRNFYFYTGDPDAFGHAAAAAMGAHPNYRYEIATTLDMGWLAYTRLLYPSEDDRQHIENRDLIATLEDKGDRVDIPREIDHHIKFADPITRRGFVEHTRKMGFRVLQEDFDLVGRFRLTIGRQDRPVDMVDIAFKLYKDAKNFGGDYDGWGCIMVTE
ncbi:MAG: DUF695 domain-containing protein [Flavobacteriaceae bacterium]